MFPFCFRVHKILSAFTIYLTIHLTIFHHLVRPLPYFLDFIFQNFLVIGFSHAIFCSQPDKPTSLEVRDIHYIKGTNLGAQLRRSFLGLAEFFCNAIIYIKSPCHTRWQRLNLSYLGDAPASKTWKRSLGPYWHFLTLASSEVSAIFLDLTFVNSHRFLYPLLSYPSLRYLKSGLGWNMGSKLLSLIMLSFRKLSETRSHICPGPACSHHALVSRWPP